MRLPNIVLTDDKRCEGDVDVQYRRQMHAVGLALPVPTKLPVGVHIPFSLINQRGTRLLISGHPRSNPDGSIGGPFGRLGADT